MCNIAIPNKIKLIEIAGKKLIFTGWMSSFLTAAGYRDILNEIGKCLICVVLDTSQLQGKNPLGCVENQRSAQEITEFDDSS